MKGLLGAFDEEGIACHGFAESGIDSDRFASKLKVWLRREGTNSSVAVNTVYVHIGANDHGALAAVCPFNVQKIVKMLRDAYGVDPTVLVPAVEPGHHTEAKIRSVVTELNKCTNLKRVYIARLLGEDSDYLCSQYEDYHPKKGVEKSIMRALVNTDNAAPRFEADTEAAEVPDAQEPEARDARAAAGVVQTDALQEVEAADARASAVVQGAMSSKIRKMLDLNSSFKTETKNGLMRLTYVMGTDPEKDAAIVSVLKWRPKLDWSVSIRKRKKPSNGDDDVYVNVRGFKSFRSVKHLEREFGPLWVN